MISGVRDDLPSDITVTYGAMTLPSNLLLTGFQTKPIWDRAQRTIIALTHTLSVKFWINTQAIGVSSETYAMAGANVPDIRAALMRPADQLILKNTSFGNYVINPIAGAQAGAMNDLIWGPKPDHFSWKPYYKYGAEIDWTVSFCLDPCGGNVKGDILEWNYGADWQIDQSGYTTRNLKGSVRIRQTRKSQTTRTLQDQADRLREQIKPPLAIGFRRTTHNFGLSEDKCTLNFTIVDVQMPPNVPPEGVVIVEASHSVESSFKDMGRVFSTIHATYEITSDRKRAEASAHFDALVKDRTKVAAEKKRTIIPIKYHMSEPEIYGRKCAEFSVTFYVVMPDEDIKAKVNGKDVEIWPPKNIVAYSGLWRPVPGSDWKKWSKSMTNSNVMLPRGTAGMAFDSHEDAIVDICVDTEKKLKPGPAPKPPKLRVSASGEERSGGVIQPDASSFLDYQLYLEVQAIDNTVILEPLPTQAVNYSPVAKSLTGTTGYKQPYISAPAAIGQYRGAPKYILTLWGRCLRAAYDVTPPVLVSVAGQKPLPQNDATCYFRTWIAANYGVPIVGAEWRFRYLLLTPPTEPFTAPANPVLGGTAQDKKEDRELGFIAQG